MNKFEQVASLGHRGGRGWARQGTVQKEGSGPCTGGGGWDQVPVEARYSEVQCIMCNGHMGPPVPNR